MDLLKLMEPEVRFWESSDAANLYLVGTMKWEALSATSSVKSTLVIAVDVSIPHPRNPAKYVCGFSTLE